MEKEGADGGHPVCGFLRPPQEEKRWVPLGVMEEREGKRRFRGEAEGRETSINPRWKIEGEEVKEKPLRNRDPFSEL